MSLWEYEREQWNSGLETVCGVDEAGAGPLAGPVYAAAVILSIVSRRSLGYFDSMSIAGLVMGIFGFVFGAVMVYMVYFNEAFFAEYEKYFWEQYNQMNPEV